MELFNSLILQCRRSGLISFQRFHIALVLSLGFCMFLGCVVLVDLEVLKLSLEVLLHAAAFRSKLHSH